MAVNQASTRGTATRPFVISFSGIDGAGKTTQIENLTSFLQSQGLRVVRLSFWDDVAVGSKLRAGVGQRTVDQSQKTSFDPKNNKHVRKWYLSAARAGFYMLDIVRLRRLLITQKKQNVDVVIFDRYVYDQVANIYSQSIAARIYGKLLFAEAPAPDLAFVIDASPAAAFARKPEYPLDFVYRNRQTFLDLRELVPSLIIVPEGRPEDVSREILRHVSRSRLFNPTLGHETSAHATLTKEKTDSSLASALEQ
jgi:dTMP kinase